MRLLALAFSVTQLLGIFSLIGGITIAAVQIGMSAARASSVLTNWQFDETENQLEITIEDGITPRYFVLEQPFQIVIDLPDTDIGSSVLETYSGDVHQISITQLQPRLTQIVMELSPTITLAPQQIRVQKLDSINGKTRWIFRPAIAQSQEFPSPQITTPQHWPARLPPATFERTNNTPTVRVPPLNRNRQTPPRQRNATSSGMRGEGDNAIASLRVSSRTAKRQPTSTPNTDLLGSAASLVTQPASISNSGQPIGRSPAPSVSAVPPTVVPVLDFGQPLPRKGSAVTAQLAATVPSLETATNASTSLLLPEGTLLTLRYPGPVEIALREDFPRQEVLLLDEEIRDPSGNLIAPAGTKVIGRFENNSRGSWFIAQAIEIGDRLLTLNGRSRSLNNSAGPTTIQPGQLLEIRLTGDRRSAIN